MHTHVFVSYKREEGHIARQIHHLLEEHGYNCWRDTSIVGGKTWKKELEHNVERADALLVVASEDAAKSDWVHRETGFARAFAKPIIPVCLDKELPKLFEPLLKKVQFVLCPRGEVNENAGEEILAALREAGLGMLHDRLDAELDWGHLEEHFCNLRTGERERLDSIADLVRRSFQATPGTPIWTVHSLRHANRLLYALSDILDESQRVDRNEVFCMIAAACLHDIGLVIHQGADGEPTSEEAAEGADDQQAQESPEARLRRTHAVLSSEWVHNNAGRLRLTGQETRTVKELVLYHNPTTNVQTLGGQPSIARLASAFRLANICDAGPGRAPIEVWNHQRDRISEAEQAGFWLRNLMTGSVIVNREEAAIEVCGRSDSEDLSFVPEQLALEIGRRQRSVAPFLGNWRVNFEWQRDPSLNLNITREDMAINGMRLVADPRATLTSSSDLVDYFVACLKSITAPDYVGSTPQRKLHCVNAMVNELVEKRPELHALHYLKQTVEDAQERRRSDEAKLTAIGDTMKKLASKRHFYPARPRPRRAHRTIFDAIAKKAVDLLPTSDRSSPPRFFAFGKSGPVTYFLQFCALSGCQVEVFTPVMRPVGEGSALQVPEALKDIEGLTCQVVPDAAIPLVLHSKLATANAQPYQASSGDGVGPNVVLMGCEAVFAQGERAKLADIGTSLGALAVAQMAHHARVPLLVLTDKAKFVADAERSPWCSPSADNAIQQLPAVDFMHEADAARWAEHSAQSQPQSEAEPGGSPEGRRRGYPRSETVPGKLVRYIVTEEEALTPAEAADKLRAMRGQSQ